MRRALSTANVVVALHRCVWMYWRSEKEVEPQSFSNMGNSLVPRLVLLWTLLLVLNRVAKRL